MAIKWKKFSYSTTSKVIAFLLVVIFYSSFLTLFINVVNSRNFNFNIASEKNYYQSMDFNITSHEIVQNIFDIISKYKNEENILNGGSLTGEKIDTREMQLDREDTVTPGDDASDLTQTENPDPVNEDQIEGFTLAERQLIQQDLDEYQNIIDRINSYNGLLYYAQKGETVFSNSLSHSKGYFKSAPAYIIVEDQKVDTFPEKIYYHVGEQIAADDVIYVAFNDEFLAPRLAAWAENKAQVIKTIYGMIGLAIALAAAFIYLLFISGRKAEDDLIHLNGSVDRIYNDINLGLCAALIAAWIGCMTLFRVDIIRLPIPVFLITVAIAAFGLTLVLSLVKHIKKRTIFTHTLIYYVFSRLFAFAKDVFNSGSTAVKVVLLVVFYPLIARLSFLLLPLVIAAAAWLALQKVKEFEVLKTGVAAVKDGDYRHKIAIPGEGELALLAADLNSITDGLNAAVANAIKSERLKSELITNVSHDIRTPLTSIITYIDLLKKEQGPEKIFEYAEVLEQKAQRLKTLTDDLFEAAKATSGNIPVNLERIDLPALLTQGLGEFDEQIRERNLDFKLKHPEGKIFINADGKLLWRAIENLLLNVFKYAQPGSRVYVDIMEEEAEAVLTIKNISACELNISAAELMQRFTRGDSARSSEGSGLGLSIAKSLITLQKGSFAIEIDGDLFKAIIRMAKAN